MALPAFVAADAVLLLAPNALAARLSPRAAILDQQFFEEEQRFALSARITHVGDPPTQLVAAASCDSRRERPLCPSLDVRYMIAA